MGVLKNRVNQRFVLLNSDHVFGRNPQAVHTLVEGHEISRSHATLVWKMHKWVLQDHSLNGTLVNQQLVHHGSMDVKKGDVIKFGPLELAEWEVVDDEAPVSYLKEATEPDRVMALAARPGIATPDHPELSFFLTRDNRWRAEISGMEISLNDGAKLKIAGEEWFFVQNEGLASTYNLGTRLSSSKVVILLSPDEERISIEIHGAGWEMEMGERVHNYLILLLARKRITDAENDFHSRDQGWMQMEEIIDDLKREFRKEVDEYQVNLHIYRIRKQLMMLEPYGYMFSNMVERRRGELRFGHWHLEIRKEGEVVGGL